MHGDNECPCSGGTSYWSIIIGRVWGYGDGKRGLGCGPAAVSSGAPKKADSSLSSLLGVWIFPVFFYMFGSSPSSFICLDLLLCVFGSSQSVLEAVV